MGARRPRSLFRKIWNNLLRISDWIIHSRGINTGETWKLELLEKVHCKNLFLSFLNSAQIWQQLGEICKYYPFEWKSNLASIQCWVAQWPKWPDLKQRAQAKEGGLTGILTGSFHFRLVQARISFFGNFLQKTEM